MTAESSSLRQADVPLGTSRRTVRELFGEPDLAISKLDKDSVVEHFVYVNQLRHVATTILLVGGKVVSVYGGIPSVSWRGDVYGQPAGASRIAKGVLASGH